MQELWLAKVIVAAELTEEEPTQVSRGPREGQPPRRCARRRLPQGGVLVARSLLAAEVAVPRPGSGR
jgi:hypothetical protein